MVLINHFIFADKLEVEVKGSYKNDGGYSYAKLYEAGFKYNKVRRTFFKTYFTRDYTNDRFDSDLKLIKSLWEGNFKYQAFKLVNEDKSY